VKYDNRIAFIDPISLDFHDVTFRVTLTKFNLIPVLIARGLREIFTLSIVSECVIVTLASEIERGRYSRFVTRFVCDQFDPSPALPASGERVSFIF
jgi:hypothetical protein